MPKAAAATPRPVPVKAAAPAPQAAQSRPAAAVRTSTAPALGSEIELPPDHLVGQIIANYRVEARIGKGPMGPVYRARQTNSVDMA